jgi:enterobactin synthetase component D / holo-[acyl-carrier protein] synthase
MLELRQDIENEMSLDVIGRLAFVMAGEMQDAGSLHATERKFIQAAIPYRQKEFATGRWCAKNAMRRIGFQEQPITVGIRREPIWPKGVTGSISHTNGLCGSVVTNADVTVGLDIERVSCDMSGIQELVFKKNEITQLEALEEKGHPAKVLAFSAKESAFKCFFPKVGDFIDFGSVSVSVDPVRRRFQVELQENLAPSLRRGYAFEGRYWVTGEFLVTFICHPSN